MGYDQGMNIWLDDQRKSPEGWIHLHNIDEVELVMDLESAKDDFCIEVMSFDFHLNHKKKGIDVMKYLGDLCLKHKTRKFWPKTILYHSDDLQGIAIMRAFEEDYNLAHLQLK